MTDAEARLWAYQHLEFAAGRTGPVGELPEDRAARVMRAAHPLAEWLLAGVLPRRHETISVEGEQLAPGDRTSDQVLVAGSENVSGAVRLPLKVEDVEHEGVGDGCGAVARDGGHDVSPVDGVATATEACGGGSVTEPPPQPAGGAHEGAATFRFTVSAEDVVDLESCTMNVTDFLAELLAARARRS